MVLFFGSSEDSSVIQEEVAASSESSIKVSAADLYSEYEANEVGADSKYKGQTVLVSGTIEDIGTDIMDDIYITLGTSNMFASVQAFFAEEQAGEVGQLTKGSQVTVLCRCDGKFMNVLLKGCQISSGGGDSQAEGGGATSEGGAAASGALRE